MIQSYFLSIRNHISIFNHINEEQFISEKTYSDTKGYLEGRITFIDDSILEFSEEKDTDSNSKKTPLNQKNLKLKMFFWKLKG